jgi:basic amino acid/polyamine antiporter, APA family
MGASAGSPTRQRDHPRLDRRLGTADAVVIGLGSMVGAGAFAVFGPAAQAAGSALLIGLAIAAVIAYANAVASAQLAAAYPVSGGTYVYGRERLGQWWGFIAGWGFVIGKTASCTAMALTFATYAIPDSWWAQRLTAVAAVVAVTALNYHGITKTAGMARILLAVTLLALAIVVGGILLAGNPGPDNLDGWFSRGPGGLYGILQAAGLLFFAFAGYARIATMGEEVRDPETTIPRAIPVALFITVVVYALVGTSVLLAAGPDRLAASAAPLVTAIESADVGYLAPVVRIGAMVASLGVLLALVAGIGRTSLAMARNGDLPRYLAAVHVTYRVPHHAEITLAVVICLLVLLTDLRGAIGFSSFGVLIYYAIANAAAFTQTGEARRWPRWLNLLGMVGCLVLVATLPGQAVGVGILVLTVGIVGRLLARHRRSAG